MKRHLLGIVACFLLFTACNEAGDGAPTSTGTLSANGESSNAEAGSTGNQTSITAIETKSDNETALAAYSPSSFSKYVYLKTGSNTFLIDFNFFPEGTDFDSQKKQATLPCEETIPTNENVNTSVNVSGNNDGCEAIVVDLAGATFTFIGLEFSYETSLDAFIEPFEFKITPEGVLDAEDSEFIDIAPEDATLENIYNAVMDRRL